MTHEKAVPPLPLHDERGSPILRCLWVYFRRCPTGDPIPCVLEGSGRGPPPSFSGLDRQQAFGTFRLLRCAFRGFNRRCRQEPQEGELGAFGSRDRISADIAVHIRFRDDTVARVTSCHDLLKVKSPMASMEPVYFSRHGTLVSRIERFARVPSTPPGYASLAIPLETPRLPMRLRR